MPHPRKLRLGAFMRPASIHTGAWRYPGAFPDANFNLAHMIRFVQTLERARKPLQQRVELWRSAGVGSVRRHPRTQRGGQPCKAGAISPGGVGQGHHARRRDRLTHIAAVAPHTRWPP